MLNSVPYEVVGAPSRVYIATEGATYPDIDATPNPAVWTLLGTDGELNYTPEGLMLRNPQTVNSWRSLGSPFVRKRFLSEADASFGVTVADLTLETFAIAIGKLAADVTDVASGGGTAGHRTLGGDRPVTIRTVALLIRVLESPYIEEGHTDYRVWRAQMMASQEINYRRDQPALLAMEWGAILDPSQADGEQLYKVFAQDTASAS